MTPLFLTLAVSTTQASATPLPWQLESYACTQTNPMQYSWFELHFRANTSLPVDRPVSARLDDLETNDLEVSAAGMPIRRDYRDPGYVAYEMGINAENGTEYLLYLPRGDLGDNPEVYVKALYGGGHAQWINEFTCARMP